MFKDGLWKHEVTPREWQVKALSFWIIKMRGIIKAATGCGKTLFALACINNYLCKKKIKNPKVLIIVPTIALQDQWIISLTEEFIIKESEIDSKNFNEDSPLKFHVLIINTARNIVISKNSNVFLIVDECHRAGSEVNSQIFNNKYKATLGLSATPERQYDNKFDEVLVPHIGDVIFEYGIKDALRDKIISPFQITNIKIPLTEDEYNKYKDETKKIARKIATSPEDNEFIKLLLLQRARTLSKAVYRIPFTVKIAIENSDKKIIIFHESILSAESINKTLNSSGIKSVCYHSKIGEHLRRDNLRLFKKGIVSVIVCCRALDEGINVPDASIGIIASSTTSSRQRIQRLGRILRPAPDKDQAMIYTLYATPSEKKRLEDEASYLSGLAEVIWVKGSVDGSEI